MKRLPLLLLLSIFSSTLFAQADRPDVHPLDLEFHRLAVRRFIFSNNLLLNEFVPAEIVSFPAMHPAFKVSETNDAVADDTFQPTIEKGRLVLTDEKAAEAHIYLGGVNPYATYELDIETIEANAEVGIELTQPGLRDRVQVLARRAGNESGVYVRIYQDAALLREYRFSDTLPEGEFLLRVQLYGRSLGVFLTEEGETRYLDHIQSNDSFREVIDFRRLDTLSKSLFNLYSNQQGRAVVKGASSYLSSGIGQADIRLISHEDLSPYIEDNRLWFTFSCRGLDIAQSAQGVLSLDPSVFDIRFEGMIVFDHGDGLLRNDYASHLFYDRQAKEWRAYVSDFGGSYELDKRSATGIVVAHSPHDPRRGFSVMRARRVEPEAMAGHNEDPCIFFDSEAGKWRLLTSAFIDGDIVSRTYESDTWDGQFTPVAMPIKMNSTGTSIQRIGSSYYCLMGGHSNLRVHTYPDLQLLGEINTDLQPHWPKPAGRVWASIVPLPEGYPYRYVLLTMDRPNFPGVKGANWSYGALYFYGANPKDISSETYEFK